MTIAEKITRAKSDYDEVYEAGKQAEYDAFWDNFQAKGARNEYIGCFGGKTWDATTLKPKYDIINAANLSYAFYSNAMAVDLVEYLNNIGRKIEWTTSNKANLNSVFQYSKFTRVFAVYSTDQSWYSTFANATNLRIIDEVGNFDGGNVTFVSSTFSQCTALEEIRIRGTMITSTNFQWSTKLTKASITSIINALSPTRSGLTLTLSKTAKESAFTTDEWEALIATKSNWSISLV